MTFLPWAAICILAGLVWVLMVEVGDLRTRLADTLALLGALQRQQQITAQAADGARLVADAAMATAMQVERR